MEWLKRIIPKQWLSALAILAFAISANTTINTEGTYDRWHSLVMYDQGGYYGYMPAFWIYEDLEFEFFKQFGFDTNSIMIAQEDGQKVNRYAIGPAVLNMPFFIIGHEIAKATEDHPAHGFSPIYKKSILIGCIFYVTLGLCFLRSILLRYYKDIVVALSILSLGVGSNLLYYTTIEGMMSHAYSFFLYSTLLWLTVKWIDDNKKLALLWIGLVMGLIACTRLPNLVVGLIPLLWGIKGKDDIRNRFELLWSQKFWIIGALALCVLGYAPQMIYYKMKVGRFFVDSYPQSRFWFDQPLPHRVLFSFRNGWLIYSPLMGMGLIGFFFIRKFCKDAFWPLLSFFIINLYVISSWWCWWYGGSFGMRALVETSALLSLTLAATIHVWIHHKYWRYLFVLIFPLLIGLNILQTHQSGNHIIRYDGMNWEAYKFVFGKTMPVTPEFIQERDSIIHYDFGFPRAATDKQYRYEKCR